MLKNCHKSYQAIVTIAYTLMYTSYLNNFTTSTVAPGAPNWGGGAMVGSKPHPPWIWEIHFQIARMGPFLIA